MDVSIRHLISRRAGNRCEYCLLPQEASLLFTFHVDHIIAKQHLDDEVDDPKALAFACNRCNAYKGTNLSSVDPVTNETVPLFNPRHDTWSNHFQLLNGEIIGTTPIGRATSRLLQMNAPQRVELREEWVADGRPFS